MGKLIAIAIAIAIAVAAMLTVIESPTILKKSSNTNWPLITAQASLTEPSEHAAPWAQAG
jgi:hypothetical protein